MAFDPPTRPTSPSTSPVSELAITSGRARDASPCVRYVVGLTSLRDDVPPVPFGRLEKLMRDELGVPLRRVFSEFDERAFAAASIRQVHRATTVTATRW